MKRLGAYFNPVANDYIQQSNVPENVASDLGENPISAITPPTPTATTNINPKTSFSSPSSESDQSSHYTLGTSPGPSEYTIVDEEENDANTHQSFDIADHC